MHKFMRHDLVWLKNDIPFVVTRQYEKNNEFLYVAQSLSADKSIMSHLATRIDINIITRHERPLLFSVLLANELTNYNPNHLKTLFSELKPQDLSILQEFDQTLLNTGLELRVFGSSSWQYFTHRQFIHKESDLDILVYITNIRQLDGLDSKFAYLEELIGYKVDGELVLANQYFISWRELFKSEQDILVKTNYDVFLINKEELLQQCQI